MINTFKKNAHFEAFQKNGFTVLQNMLSAEDIAEIKQYYKENIKGPINNTDYGMYISLDEPDISKRQKTVTDIQGLLQPKLEPFLENIKCHLGAFLIKVPNPRSFTFPHQDWLFVDNNKTEDLFSATIWISLEDISPESGSLGFIKGSHQFLNNIVGSPSPQLVTATMGHEGLLLGYLDFPEVKAGDALMFNNKTVHAAFPNNSDFDRMAIGIGITPKDADLFHYFLKPGTTDKIYKLKVSNSFFINNIHDQLRDYYTEGKTPPETEIVAELEYIPRLFSTEELEKTMIENGNIKNNSPMVEMLNNYMNGGTFSKIKATAKYFLSKIMG